METKQADIFLPEELQLLSRHPCTISQIAIEATTRLHPEPLSKAGLDITTGLVFRLMDIVLVNRGIRARALEDQLFNMTNGQKPLRDPRSRPLHEFKV